MRILANDTVHAKESKFHGNWSLNYQLKGAVINWQLTEMRTHCVSTKYEIAAYKIHDVVHLF